MKLAPSKNKKKSPAKEGIKDNSFPIVAIGASAGGLEAVSLLLRNLPPDTGMSFIYVQHLSPDHKSILTSLLAKTTLMKVQEVTNKIFMKPDNLYVIPPDKEMTVLDGHIKLTPRRNDRGVSLPIDTFFSTLAEKHGSGAIGVILSGSASDGTLGLKAIKDGGGLTFAQDDSAKFSSMPKSAIAAGAVDFVLSPKEIAHELTRLGKHFYAKHDVPGVVKENEIESSDPSLKIVFNLLQKETGADFSHYKIATIKRRIQRRMLLYKIKSLKQYAKLLVEKSDEINILYQDLLINVTAFFRDADAHQYLKTTLFPKILKSKTADQVLRIWTPACSTGEEAFSIAMTILEIQSSKSDTTRVQIFATDISEKAIAKARVGEYSKHELESVSPKRLLRFYSKTGNTYRIAKVVRDMCVFAPHNVLRDPPFSKVDFVSCCNLLIYLDTAAQKKAITTFHYALNDGGYLMLGQSETIGALGQLFSHINVKFKIYARKKTLGQRSMPQLLPRQEQTALPEKNNRIKFEKNRPLHDIGFDSAIDSVLLSRYMPASVVINHAMEILQFRGATDLYLKHSSGKASLNILKMTAPEIAFELRTAIAKAIKTKQTIRKEGIEMKDGAGLRLINTEVLSLSMEWEEPLLLILFTESVQVEKLLQEGKGARANGHGTNGVAKDRRIKKLEQELTMLRADMHAFTQDQEAFSEELQSTNEEVVSSNEELQSVNEELETSKEEIESANEELTTTNHELQTRNDLLNESYDYSAAIISTMHEPMLILDKHLRVKSANMSFYRNFREKEEETEGTPLYDLGNKQWNIPRLRELLEDIIPKNTHFHDFEVTHVFHGIGKKILLLNASRIVQKSHGQQLILLAINDITEHTLAQSREKEQLKKDIKEGKLYTLKLEKAVGERTKELGQANITLEEKNEELQKMNKELEAFAYVSSHDLQEPLRKIQTFAKRILETESQNLTEKGTDYFSRMRAAARRMQKLIEDLLAFSHLTIKERKFENGDLNKIVEDVKSELKETIEEKQATIEATKLCEVKIIPFQFRQVMHNLVSNALKFASPERLPLIIVKSRIEKGSVLNKEKNALPIAQARELSPEKKYCHISVSDNGIGFNPLYKDRIFEVFQKLHGNDEYVGTGIGLAIVKKVVENHNGIITVTSELNKGATFNIYIPAF